MTASDRLFPARLALHQAHPQRGDHVDCFIDVGPDLPLLVFELATSICPIFWGISPETAPAFVFYPSDRVKSTGIWEGPVRQLPDHRRLYFALEGSITGNRGVLQGLGHVELAESCLTADRWKLVPM